MSDRVKGCWVAFESDLHEDAARHLMDAIRQLRGVSAVAASVADSGDWLARQHVKEEFRGAMLDLYQKL